MSKRNAEEIIQAVEHYIRVESKQISWAPIRYNKLRKLNRAKK